MTVLSVLPLLLGWADQSPEPEDVKAGWVAFGLFVVGVIAVVLLGLSLVRHLRTADRAQADGVFDRAAADRAGGRDQQGPTHS